jgi:sigma-B regulation protein RsbU (phosphoserine phosphatase)
MAANIIGATVLLLVIFGLIVSLLGVANFTSSFKKEFAVTSYHMADTATTLVNGDHIDAYIRGEETEEYDQTMDYTGKEGK